MTSTEFYAWLASLFLIAPLGLGWCFILLLIGLVHILLHGCEVWIWR